MDSIRGIDEPYNVQINNNGNNEWDWAGFKSYSQESGCRSSTDIVGECFSKYSSFRKMGLEHVCTLTRI